MRFLKVLVFTVVLAVLFSCTKKVATYEQTVENGIKITKNTGVPADSTFKIELKEVGFIDNENETDTVKFLMSASDFNFDESGNLYFMDSEKNRIHKYDNNYKFIKSFGRSGKGPGEFFYPGFMNVRKDTIYIPNWTSLQIIKFDTDGNYLSNKMIDDMYKFPAYPYKFGEKYICQIVLNKLDENQKMVFAENVSLYDPHFNHIKNIFYIEYPFTQEREGDPGANGFEISLNDSVLFASVKSKDKYQIDVYDNDGNKKREIRKNYKRTKAGSGLQNHFDEINKKSGSKYKVLYVNSIMSMKADKYGRLWVNVYNDNDLEGHEYDIFQDDIYINRIKLNIDKEYTMLTVGEKIIAVNPNNNNIKVYEY